jgi:mono/diheme cytochrome c family protein
MARRAHFVVLLPLLVGSAPAIAQDSTHSDQEKLGERLFDQSCVVCHKIPQLGVTAYAPALSMNTLGGNADAIHEVISDGTSRMPGFKIQFVPTQIDAIVAYIKTIPATPSAPPPNKAKGAGEPD